MIMCQSATGEKIFAMTSKRLESFQNVNGLFGQWDKMRLLHLHLFRGDGPDCRVKVDFGPFGLPQFSRSDNEQGSKLQGAFDNERDFKGIYGAEQGGNVFRVGRRRHVFMFEGRKDFAQV